MPRLPDRPDSAASAERASAVPASAVSAVPDRSGSADLAPPGSMIARTAVRVRRFTRAERWVHRSTAALMGVCLVTAGCLYLPPLAELVGRRALVVTVHEWSGLLLPVPFLLGLASRAFRGDVRVLGRFGPHDRRWLRAALRRDHRHSSRPAGKFNAGQKLYASYAAGAVLVMLGTGLLMWFTRLAPLSWRTGATFVHDWLALALGIVVAGHIGKALADPEARRGLRTGTVDGRWARREHPLWRPDDEPVASPPEPVPAPLPEPAPAPPPEPVPAPPPEPVPEPQPVPEPTSGPTPEPGSAHRPQGGKPT